LFLTDKGRAIYAAVVPEHEALIAEQLAALDPAEQRELLRLLRTLDHSLA
jgi:DNA-binding MarR family transcriptional regulator